MSLSEVKLIQKIPLCWVIAPGQANQENQIIQGEFDKIADELAGAKSQLDIIPQKMYTELSRELDLYGTLKRRLMHSGNLPVVTTATLKMYEMLNTCDLVFCSFDGILVPRFQKDALLIRAFCNAELPGAFLIALNLYVRTLSATKTVDFEWLASSYMPKSRESQKDATILDDAYGIYTKNRDHWLMGPQPNAMPPGEPPVDGDVTNSSVVAALSDAIHKKFPAILATDGSILIHSGATLYTSDAGIDVTSDYNKQEESTVLLNFGQVVCGLLSLTLGGVLVTKQYTFFTKFNRELIALLSNLFDCLKIVKPLTSRPANSEIYLIGTGFRGVSRALADDLLDTLTLMKSKSVKGESLTEEVTWAPYLASNHDYLPASNHDYLPASNHDYLPLHIARELSIIQIRYLNEIMAVYSKVKRMAPKDRFRALKEFVNSSAQNAIELWLAANPVVKK